MVNQLVNSTSQEQRVNEVIAAYLQAVQAGQTPDRQQLLARHPDLADELASFFADQDQFDRLAAPLRAALPPVCPAEASAGLGGAAAVRGQSSDAELTETGTLGDFRILREVGRGGMGVVYEAEQISLGRRVALKVLPYAATMDAKQLQRFKNEARAAAGLKHEHIVQVFGVGCERGVHFYSMEFIDGQTLAQLITGMALAGREVRAPAPDRTAAFVPTSSNPSVPATGPGTPSAEQDRAKPSSADTGPVAALSTERSGPKGRSFYRSAAELMAQAADALEHAHELGLVHRDVKPGNLMVDTAGKLWVTDFGLARFGPDAGLTLSGDLLGTLRYMAPEQALSHHGLVDHRADIYALGATLYELLSGRPVVAASERGEILRQIAFEEPTRPRKLDKSIPIELETITMKCLTKNPSERYATAGALSEDLRRFLADQPIRARRTGSVERVRRWGRRHPALVAVYVLLVLVVALGTAGGAAAWQWQVAEGARDFAESARVLAEEAHGRALAALQGERKAQAGEAEAQRQRDEIKALNNRLQRTLYASNMNLAKNALDIGGDERVRDLLQYHRPKPGETDLRGFEWYLLDRLCPAELLTINGRDCVAYSPDGKRLACSANNKVKVYDALTGQELLTIKGGGGYSVAFSPDGKRIVASSSVLGSGELKVWDAQTGQELLNFEGHTNRITSAAFSPDGKKLASASEDKTVRVWDAQTGKGLLTIKGHNGGVTSVSFSSDGKRLASGSNRHDTKKAYVAQEVKVWDAETGEELHSLKGHTNGIKCVAFSSDGKRLASGGAGPGLLGEGPGEVKVWDTQTGQEVLSIKGFAGMVMSLAFSPDGKRIASGDTDSILAAGPGHLKVWDAQTGQQLFTRKYKYDVWSVAFSADGKRVASAGVEIKVWDAEETANPVILKAGSIPVACIAFSPNGKRLASASNGLLSESARGYGPGQVKVWDSQTGKQLLFIKLPSGTVNDVAFSPDGKTLASSISANRPNTGGEVRVWDAETGQELLALKENASVLYNMGFRQDGKILVSTGFGVKVWDAQTGKELPMLVRGPSGNLAFSADGGRLASARQLQGSTLWNAQTGQQVLAIKSEAWRVAFSPNGKHLATTSKDNTMKLWDAQTGDELLFLKGHTRWVGAMAFSPDGNRLASASSDKTVKVWDVQTGQELLTVEGHNEYMNGVAFSSDGNRLASGAGDGTVKIWDATPLPEKR